MINTIKRSKHMLNDDSNGQSTKTQKYVLKQQRKHTGNPLIEAGSQIQAGSLTEAGGEGGSNSNVIIKAGGFY